VSLGKGEKEDERCDGCDCSSNYRECLSAKKERRKTSGLTAVTVVQITG